VIRLLTEAETKMKIRYQIIAPLIIAVVLSACEGGIVVKEEGVPSTAQKVARNQEAGRYDSSRETVFGDGGIGFGTNKNSGGGDGGGGIGVNSYLWRATLDTISFMPVTTADPHGGVILTDWHASNESPNERFKMNIYILGRQLRADGIRVAVFRQVLQNQLWRDADVPNGTSTKIEDAVLMRARQLRNQVLGQE